MPSYPAGNITVAERDDAKIRAFREDVLAHLEEEGQLVDVRSPEEFRGERTHMPEYPQEGCLRGGHIPGAKSMPWAKAVDPETHTFRPADELRKLYEQDNGLKKSAGDDRLLPDRRALVAHLVRAHLSARLRQRPELRRLVDRVGQRGAAAGREAGRSKRSGKERRDGSSLRDGR